MFLDLAPKIFWQILLAILVLVLAYLIRDILALVLIALVVAAVLQPAVNYLVAKRWPRSLAILVWYFVAIGLVTFVFAVMAPPITRELRQLSYDFPYAYSQAQGGLHVGNNLTPVGSRNLLEEFLMFLGQWREAAGRDSARGIGSLGVIFGIFGGFVSFLSVLVMAFYMLLEREGLSRLVAAVVRSENQARILNVLTRMQEKMGLWLRGQLVLMLIVAVLTYIALLILGVRFALVLALLAGLLEIIPFIGPITAAVPAFLIALAESPIKAVAVLVIYIVIQQVENHILVPKIMSKTIGLSPLIVIVAVLVGAKLGGIVGTLLAVPILTALSVLWEERESLTV